MARLRIPFRSVAVEFPAVTGACVTNAPGDGVFPLNPAGVPRGEVGVYRLGILPTNANLQVSWTASSGNVGLTAMRQKGKWRGVVAKGLQPGEFTLTAQFPDGILGMSDPPHIRAAVLEPKVIPLHVYILRSPTGSPLVDGNEVDDWIKEVNTLFRQTAMKFQRKTTDYIDREESRKWLDIAMNNGSATNLLSYVNVTNGLEVYCVYSINGGNVAGCTPTIRDGEDNDWYGIAIDVSDNNHYPARVLAHEIAHCCGLKDIFPRYLTPSSQLSMKTLLGGTNWTGGNDTINYLTDGMSYSNIVTSLLMYGFSTPFNWDIPYGRVNGVTNFMGGTMKLLPVGLDTMNREPSH